MRASGTLNNKQKLKNTTKHFQVRKRNKLTSWNYSLSKPTFNLIRHRVRIRSWVTSLKRLRNKRRQSSSRGKGNKESNSWKKISGNCQVDLFHRLILRTSKPNPPLWMPPCLIVMILRKPKKKTKTKRKQSRHQIWTHNSESWSYSSRWKLK